jgi:hypothetical protein
VPVPGAQNARFDGRLATCLPPSLNHTLATGADLQALQAMSQQQFNQDVFRFCSEDVADWLSLTVKSQVARIAQVPAGLGCEPYRCKCATNGATTNYGPCERQCDERPCNQQSCMPILRQEGYLETDSCLCGRTEACGFVAPAKGKPPLCRVLVLDSLDGHQTAN